MDKQTAIEKLKAMANEPKDSLKKFLAKEILTHDEPLDFFSLVEKFGMETVYHYEDPLSRICNPITCGFNIREITYKLGLASSCR